MAGESETRGVPEVGDTEPGSQHNPTNIRLACFRRWRSRRGQGKPRPLLGNLFRDTLHSKQDNGEYLQRQSREGAGRGPGGAGVSGKGGNKWMSLGCHGFENLLQYSVRG